jgi:hypothetical protein
MKFWSAVKSTLLVAFLASCAAPNVDRSAANFIESNFSADLNTCRGGNIAEATIETIGVGLLGSLGGAALVATHGAVAAGSGEAVVVGAIVGATVGLGIGANDAIEEHDQKIADCLRKKGYEVVKS